MSKINSYSVLGRGEGSREVESCLRGEPVQHAPRAWAPCPGKIYPVDIFQYVKPLEFSLICCAQEVDIEGIQETREEKVFMHFLITSNILMIQKLSEYCYLIEEYTYANKQDKSETNFIIDVQNGTFGSKNLLKMGNIMP